MGRFNEILQNNTGLLLLLLIGLLGLVLVFLVLHLARGRKAQSESLRGLLKAQEQLLGDSSALLAKQLMAFTSTQLVETVQAGYERMVAQDLLPSVNAAAAVVAELSSAVVKRQESGMAELANDLAALFTARTEHYLEQEAEVVAAMNGAAGQFAGQLAEINETAMQLSAQYGEVYQKANTISETLSSAVSGLGAHLAGLENTLEKNAGFAQSMQSCILESGAVVKSITQTVEQMQQITTKAVGSVAAQQETTAELLSDAIATMRQNTEDSAKAVLSEFGAALSANNRALADTITALRDATESMHKNTEEAAATVLNEFSGALLANNGALGETVAALREVMGGMENTADRFAAGVSEAYNQFNMAVDTKVAQLSTAFSESAEQEYQKLLNSAETYATGFSRDISSLGEALESHLANLHTITHQLSNTVDSFKNDADASTHRFETGIEQLVSSALKEMDSSLAEIVGRLVAVAASIGEAADALPRAVCSIRDANTEKTSE
ncbi:MAG: hypothetical protein LBS36_03520 [Oscillospiraceae bacterium]|nr:hypothetical protein [Oscillospiraceae bacterium]